MRIKTTVMTHILAFTLSTSALSANVAFLYDTPAQYFSDQDWKILEATSEYALSKLPNGKSATWQNPQTGHSGSLTPLNSIKKNGTLCRNLQITNHAQHRTDRYVFLFCKLSTGWKVPTKPM